jgi:hypothetical protein
VIFLVWQHDAASYGYRGVLEDVRITERERERDKVIKRFGVLPRLRIAQHAYAHNKAKRSGEAECSGEGDFGGLPRLQYNTTRPRAQQAKRIEEGAFLRLQCKTTRHEKRLQTFS